MRTQFRNLALVAGALVIALLGTSCAPRLGWGLLLWTDPEAGLHAGAVVPVYIRSNIDKKYVIGVPGTNRKVEVPLWQLDLYRSKRAAEKSRAVFGEFLTSYFFANRDGLPVRDTPSNLGKRVYRLREGQSLKILSPAEGEVVKTGDAALDGSWYKVLTEDGTRGYVFSNTLRLYDELVESPPTTITPTEDQAVRNVDLVFARTWRAEYFQTMIDDGRIDLDAFNSRYGLFADAVRRQVRIELPITSQVFNYTSIAQSGSDFLFEGTPLKISFDGDKRLVADWSGPVDGALSALTPADGQALAQAAPAATAPVASATAAVGAAGNQTGQAAANPAATPVSPGVAQPDAASSIPTSAVFVTLAQDIRDVIRAEETRRINLLGRFADGGTAWTFAPEGATGESRLIVSRSGRFTWSAIASVPPDYLGPDLGDVSNGTASGEATVRLEVDPSLAITWEGVLSLRFDGTRGWLDFFYRHEGGRLILEPLSPGGERDMMAIAASSMPPLRLEATR